MSAAILLVEDEALIRMMVADMIVDLGHRIADEAGDLPSGLALAKASQFDLAILDVKLGSDSSEPIADVIAGRGLPFAFASGYGAAGIPLAYRDRPVLNKPFQSRQLASVIETLLNLRR
jgi:CheY-like chemotaxis protein